MDIQVHQEIVMAFLLTILLKTAAEKIHKFHVGANASILFSHRLAEKSSEVHETICHNEHPPFYTDKKQIDSMALQSDQQSRFAVTIERQGERFTATLDIYNIQDVDRGSYKLSLIEMLPGISHNYTLEAKIDVVIPPGKSKCNVATSLYSPHWNEVTCTATLGSDEEGLLLCYQNAEKAPLNGLYHYSSTYVKAKFWMRIDLPIYCCSFNANHEKDHHSCRDFVYYPEGKCLDKEQFSPEERTIEEHYKDHRKTENMGISSSHKNTDQADIQENNLSIVYMLSIILFMSLIILMIVTRICIAQLLK